MTSSKTLFPNNFTFWRLTWIYFKEGVVVWFYLIRFLLGKVKIPLGIYAQMRNLILSPSIHRASTVQEKARPWLCRQGALTAVVAPLTARVDWKAMLFQQARGCSHPIPSPSTRSFFCCGGQRRERPMSESFSERALNCRGSIWALNFAVLLGSVSVGSHVINDGT